MKELAAYLLLVLSGNATPSNDDVKGVLSSVGIEASDEELTRLTTSLEGKDLDSIVEEGRKKLVNVGGGGGGGCVHASLSHMFTVWCCVVQRRAPALCCSRALLCFARGLPAFRTAAHHRKLVTASGVERSDRALLYYAVHSLSVTRSLCVRVLPTPLHPNLLCSIVSTTRSRAVPPPLRPVAPPPRPELPPRRRRRRRRRWDIIMLTTKYHIATGCSPGNVRR